MEANGISCKRCAFVTEVAPNCSLCATWPYVYFLILMLWKLLLKDAICVYYLQKVHWKHSSCQIDADQVELHHTGKVQSRFKWEKKKRNLQMS
jgi:hypothetical protein